MTCQFIHHMRDTLAVGLTKAACLVVRPVAGRHSAAALQHFCSALWRSRVADHGGQSRSRIKLFRSGLRSNLFARRENEASENGKPASDGRFNRAGEAAGSHNEAAGTNTEGTAARSPQGAGEAAVSAAASAAVSAAAGTAAGTAASASAVGEAASAAVGEAVSAAAVRKGAPPRVRWLASGVGGSVGVGGSEVEAAVLVLKERPGERRSGTVEYELSGDCGLWRGEQRPPVCPGAGPAAPSDGADA